MAKRKIATFSFQPDPLILEAIKRQAGLQDRTVSKMMNIYLRKALEAEGLLEPRRGQKKEPPSDG